jgi:hypothetical protein
MHTTPCVPYLLGLSVVRCAFTKQNTAESNFMAYTRSFFLFACVNFATQPRMCKSIQSVACTGFLRPFCNEKHYAFSACCPAHARVLDCKRHSPATEKSFLSHVILSCCLPTVAFSQHHGHMLIFLQSSKTDKTFQIVKVMHDAQESYLHLILTPKSDSHTVMYLNCSHAQPLLCAVHLRYDRPRHEPLRERRGCLPQRC